MEIKLSHARSIGLFGLSGICFVWRLSISLWRLLSSIVVGSSTSRCHCFFSSRLLAGSWRVWRNCRPTCVTLNLLQEHPYYLPPTPWFRWPWLMGCGVYKHLWPLIGFIGAHVIKWCRYLLVNMRGDTWHPLVGLISNHERHFVYRASLLYK